MNFELTEKDLIEIVQGLQDRIKCLTDSKKQFGFMPQDYYEKRIAYLQALILKLGGGITDT